MNPPTPRATTPLEAAKREAASTKGLAARLNHEFASYARCPTSKLFPSPESVRLFYAKRGRQVVGYERDRQPTQPNKRTRQEIHNAIIQPRHRSR